MLTPRLRTSLLSLGLSLGLSLPTGAAGASPLPDYPFVHVAGSAFTTVMPDIAALDFEIVAVDADPAAARATIEARLDEMRALLRQLDIDADDAVVREVRQALRKAEPGGADASAAPQYELRCDVHINVRNVANWAALAGGLYGKPNLDGFASSFDLSTFDKVKDALMTEAIQDARRHADVMAAAFGRRVGTVMGATPDALKNLSTAMGLQREEFRMPRGNGAATAQGMDRDQLLLIQAIKLSQPVDIVFRLDAPARNKARR